MTTPAQGPSFYDSALAPFDESQLPFPRNAQTASPAVSGQLLTGTGLVTFASWRNHATTAVSQFSVYDGTDTSGERLFTMNIPAGGGDTLSPGGPGIPYRIGLFVEVRAGSFVLTVTYRPIMYPLPG